MINFLVKHSSRSRQRAARLGSVELQFIKTATGWGFKPIQNMLMWSLWMGLIMNISLDDINKQYKLKNIGQLDNHLMEILSIIIPFKYNHSLNRQI